jgi:hypothetical protein
MPAKHLKYQSLNFKFHDSVSGETTTSRESIPRVMLSNAKPLAAAMHDRDDWDTDPSPPAQDDVTT